MIKYTLRKDSFENIESIITKDVINLFCDEGMPFFRTYGNFEELFTIFISEDYSLSTNSRLTINIIGVSRKDQTEVNVLVSGGKVGFIWETSYGSENRRAKSICEIFKQNGFVLINEK